MNSLGSGQRNDGLGSAARRVRVALTALVVAVGCRRTPPYQGDWHDLHRGEQDSRIGFVDRTGRFVIKPDLKLAARFTEGLAAASTGRGGYGYIDKTGQWAISPQFNHAWEFSEGLAAIEDREQRWGFIDTSGRFRIEPRFDEAHRFVGGLAAVKLGKEWAFVDKTGRLMFNRRFPDSSGFLYWKSDFTEDGVAVVELRHGRFALLATDGQTIAEIDATDVHRFSQGLARLALVRLPHDDVCESQVYRYIDTTGAWAFPRSFCDARDFADGMAQVFAEGKWGYIDRSGAFAIEPRFTVTGGFSEGLAPVKIDGRSVSWDYIDKEGKVVIPNIGAARADDFRNGLAAIDTWCPNGYWAEGARWGYIDRTGRLIVEFTRTESRHW